MNYFFMMGYDKLKKIIEEVIMFYLVSEKSVFVVSVYLVDFVWCVGGVIVLYVL